MGHAYPVGGAQAAGKKMPSVDSLKVWEIAKVLLQLTKVYILRKPPTILFTMIKLAEKLHNKGRII